ncbi:MAG: hypothetical protein PHS46_07885 [Candidatus Omnitrophica bacterium]|nr:hypothetical protein [Candidatus Omnitrophota bacterium]
MIDEDQLERLRLIDANTFARFYRNDCFQRDDFRREAVLQAVLQETIAEKGYGFHQVQFAPGGCWERPHAMISDGERAPIEADGDSPAAALLACYLKAIGAT